MPSENEDRYAGWGRKLEKHFGDWKSRVEEWADAKKKLECGQAVEGIVIARAPFGAWLDIGIGFPALLEIIHIADLEPVDYQAGRWGYEGTAMSASVYRFGDDSMALSLTQKPGWTPGHNQTVDG